MASQCSCKATHCTRTLGAHEVSSGRHILGGSNLLRESPPQGAGETIQSGVGELVSMSE